MTEYKVKLSSRAVRDLDEVYCYIADTFKELGTAEKMADRAVGRSNLQSGQDALSRAERRTGAFANKGYRNCL